MDYDKVIRRDDIETFKRYFKQEEIPYYLERIGIMGHIAEDVFRYLLKNVDINTPIHVKPCERKEITHFLDLLVYENRNAYLEIIRDSYEGYIDIDILDLIEFNDIEDDILELIVDILIKDEDTLQEKYKQIVKLDERYGDRDVYRIFKYKYFDLKYDCPF